MSGDYFMRSTENKQPTLFPNVEKSRLAVNEPTTTVIESDQASKPNTHIVLAERLPWGYELAFFRGDYDPEKPSENP